MPNQNNYDREREFRLNRARRRKKAKIRRCIFFTILIILFIAIVFLFMKSVLLHIANNDIPSQSTSQNNSISADNSLIDNSLDDTSNDISADNSTTEITPTPDAAANKIDTSDIFSLILINENSPLPDDFTAQVSALSNGYMFDTRAIQDFEDMLAAASNDGIPLLVCSTYRSIEYQQGLLDKRINEYLNKGYDEQQAYEIAITINAIPGRSEHNSGLAADIVALDYQVLDSGFENTKQFEWLSQNADKYGFIMRYPKDKQDITGIIYEPWHYRYVGKEYSTIIKNSGLCLEEWLLENAK